MTKYKLIVWAHMWGLMPLSLILKDLVLGAGSRSTISQFCFIFQLVSIRMSEHAIHQSPNSLFCLSKLWCTKAWSSYSVPSWVGSMKWADGQPNIANKQKFILSPSSAWKHRALVITRTVFGPTLTRAFARSALLHLYLLAPRRSPESWVRSQMSEGGGEHTTAWYMSKNCMCLLPHKILSLP